MKELCKLLNLNRWGDFQESAFGAQAKHMPEIGPDRFEVEVFKVLDPLALDEVVKFARPVPALPIKSLYQLCNGMRVGHNKFAIYTSPNDLTLTWPSALSLNTPNVYGRPKGFPKTDFIIGFSTYQAANGQIEKAIHALDEEGTPYVFWEERPNFRLRNYDCLEAWLVAEFELCIS